MGQITIKIPAPPKTHRILSFKERNEYYFDGSELEFNTQSLTWENIRLMCRGGEYYSDYDFIAVPIKFKIGDKFKTQCGYEISIVDILENGNYILNFNECLFLSETDLENFIKL